MNDSKWTSPKRRTLASESSLMSVALAALITLGTYAVMATPNEAHAISARPVANQTIAAVKTVAEVQPIAEVQTIAAVKIGSSTASIASLTQDLSDSLQEQPDDASGWLLLARSYEHLGRRDEALVALNRARDLGETDAEFEMILMGENPSPQ
jgi:cytochrome c-type biogenesis protein CcmH/NrfG